MPKKNQRQIKLTVEEVIKMLASTHEPTNINPCWQDWFEFFFERMTEAERSSIYERIKEYQKNRWNGWYQKEYTNSDEQPTIKTNSEV